MTEKNPKLRRRSGFYAILKHSPPHSPWISGAFAPASFRRFLTVLAPLCLILIFASSCARAPLATSVEFRGKVYYGAETDSGKILVLGPLSGARVACLNTNDIVLTNAAGAYTLKAEASRQFLSSDYDTYILEASGTSSPSIYPAGNYINQQIEVRGGAGKTIYVRDFLLYRNKQ
ncbi:MAG: hypothetical protein QME32_05310 [Endomicrobiia bacterium]|nr:hypothetical protein [Endomicrobiia bacterium]